MISTTMTKRLAKFRNSFIKDHTALSPPVDYLPDNHWVRYRLNTIQKGRIIRIIIWNNPKPLWWFWNEYGVNK